MYGVPDVNVMINNFFKQNVIFEKALILREVDATYRYKLRQKILNAIMKISERFKETEEQLSKSKRNRTEENKNKLLKTNIDRTSEIFWKELTGKEITYNKVKDTLTKDFFKDLDKNTDLLITEAYHSFKQPFKEVKESPKISYKKIAHWENEIESLKKEKHIFNDKDNEDIRIAAEYLAYVNERGNAKFYSSDKDFIKSLNKLRNKYKGKQFPEAERI